MELYPSYDDYFNSVFEFSRQNGFKINTSFVVGNVDFIEKDVSKGKQKTMMTTIWNNETSVFPQRT